jgi:LmbE family N-acetylglucosaminyl deacetylase
MELLLTQSHPAALRPSPGLAGEALEALCLGKTIARPTVVVVAHPDDETIGLGGRLAGFEQLTLVHLTDGAPQNGADARRSGFPGREAYRAGRAAELAAAVWTLGLGGRLISFNLPDQEASLRLEGLARRLTRLLEGADLVITHAYEGGHPDHDAAAFAVQAACALIARDGRAAPARLEFAGYHRGTAGRVTNAFWPNDQHPEVKVTLAGADLRRKRAALACFRSQAEVIGWFDPAQEAYRGAPDYDFRAPPPCGKALYDDWALSIDSRVWRARARIAMAELGLRVRK